MGTQLLYRIKQIFYRKTLFEANLHIMMGNEDNLLLSIIKRFSHDRECRESREALSGVLRSFV